jgi:phospholipid/cholesterol/gamma-HCH transport system substrate-binding protein
MKRRDEVLVGLFTLAAITVAVLGALWLAQGGLSKGYPLYTRFAWGQGLKQGQPVWLSGATVGFVDNIKFEPGGTLLVTYRIENQYQVPLGTTATILPNGFFGDVAVGLTPSAPNTQYFASGDTVPVGAPQAGIAKLTASADTITQQVNAILSGAKTQFVDSGGMSEMRATIESLNRLIGQFGRIATLQSQELQSTIQVVRARAASIDSQQVDSTVRALRATTQNVQLATAELKQTADRMNSILAKVESGDGTAAKLINDAGLYNDMRRLLMRVDSLTLDFKKNPRKFINLEIF